MKTKVNYKRLLKLASFLDTLPRSRFDFGIICKKEECGTVGCAIGWTPKVFPRLVKWEPIESSSNHIDVISRRTGAGFPYIGIELFNMPEDDVYTLFNPWEPSPADGRALMNSTRPKAVANRVRKYVAWMKNNES